MSDRPPFYNSNIEGFVSYRTSSIAHFCGESEEMGSELTPLGLFFISYRRCYLLLDEQRSIGGYFDPMEGKQALVFVDSTSASLLAMAAPQ